MSDNTEKKEVDTKSEHPIADKISGVLAAVVVLVFIVSFLIVILAEPIEIILQLGIDLIEKGIHPMLVIPALVILGLVICVLVVIVNVA